MRLMTKQQMAVAKRERRRWCYQRRAMLEAAGRDNARRDAAVAHMLHTGNEVVRVNRTQYNLTRDRFNRPMTVYTTELPEHVTFLDVFALDELAQ